MSSSAAHATYASAAAPGTFVTGVVGAREGKKVGEGSPCINICISISMHQYMCIAQAFLLPTSIYTIYKSTIYVHVLSCPVVSQGCVVVPGATQGVGG